MTRKPGISYYKRVAEVNRIYDRYAKDGLPNREIWRRYIYPVYGICERTFYNMLKAPTKSSYTVKKDQYPSLFSEDYE